MPIAKCVVTGDMTTRNSSIVHSYYPLKAKIKMQGSKKPDTFEAQFPVSNDLDESYIISYIQDIADTTWLSAVYPMQLSCLDESGYNQDPTDPADSRFVNVTSGRFKGHYALDFTAISQGVSVPSAKTNKIDLSGQFDINIFFTPDTSQIHSGSDEPIFWSFRGGSGVDIGISNQYDSVWRIFVRSYGASNNAYRGSLQTVMTGAPVHVRCKRGSDNIFTVYVNGIQEELKDVQSSSSPVWNGNATGSMQPNTGTDMIFGDGSGSNADYKGQIHQIKVYCGSTLSLEDATRIRSSKPIAQFMKFNGRIRKVESDQISRKIQAESNSFKITTAKLGGIGGSLSPQSLSSVSFKVIAQSALDVVSPSSGHFTVRNVDSFAAVQSDYTLSGNIEQIGSVVNFISILLLYSNCIMYFTPRQNLIIESNAGHATDYIFDQDSTTSGCNIMSSEINNSQVITEVILTGKGGIKSVVSYTPTDDIIRTLRRNVIPIVNGGTDLPELAKKISLDLQGKYKGTIGRVTPKYVIASTVPIHHTKYNQTVTVKRTNGSAVTFSPTRNSTDIDEVLIVRQVEWNYPSGKTLINVGENDIDSFDDSVREHRKTDGLLDTTL